MNETEKQIDFGWRRNGSPAARKAADYIRREFEQAGLRTTVEPWPFNVFYPTDWGVTLLSSRATDGPAWKVNSYPIWYTKPAEVEGELVDVGLGTPAEIAAKNLKGKIALVNSVAVLNLIPSDNLAGTYKAAVAAGAKGFIRSSDAPDNLVRLLGQNQSIDSWKEPPAIGEIPGMTVGARDFARLRDAAAAGDARMRLTLRTEDVPKGGWKTVQGGSLGPGKHVLRGAVDDVVGVLPGQSLREVLVVGAHYDTSFSGAVDNATGAAMMLALMRHYTALPLAQRPKTMVFLGAGGHDTGDVDLGHFIEKHKDDLLPRVVAWDWLDHVSGKGSVHVPTTDPDVPTGTDEFRGLIGAPNPLVLGLVTRNMFANRLPFGAYLGPFSSVSFLPAYMPSFNVTMAPTWYHSAEDTLDKVDEDQLGRMAAGQVATLDELQTIDGKTTRAAQAKGGQPLPDGPWALPDMPPCGPGSGNGPRIEGPGDSSGRPICDNRDSSSSDSISGTTRGDVIRCGFGQDRVEAAGGADLVLCDSAAEEPGGLDPNRIDVNGPEGTDDVIAGGAGDDHVVGGVGNDQLRGDAGNDVLRGGSGNDRIHARDGFPDRISCGPGRDRVIADRKDRISPGCETVRRPARRRG
ncbi:MAG: M28 family peptidase [Solirubrobacteraceae bacterium]